MRHNYSTYYFTDNFDINLLNKLNKKISIIYRNYNNKQDFSKIKKLSQFCRKFKRKFFISNNLKLALKLKADGVYLPAFNKNLYYKNKNLKKNFLFIGSAHTLSEIKVKELQGCGQIFLSPLFKSYKGKKILGLTKFKYLSISTKKEIVALGGINRKNLNKLNLLNVFGFAGISGIKKTG